VKKRSGITIIMMLCAFALPVLAPIPPLGSVRINEVCWGGSDGRTTAEWIELVNATGQAVDLSGWRLVSSDGAPDVRLHGTIGVASKASPGEGFYLLERDSDDAVPGTSADVIYSGALSDAGETLLLYDAEDRLIDTANGAWEIEGVTRWPAGTNEYGEPPFASMERIDSRFDDAPGNWATFTAGESGSPDGGLFGTPRAENSVFNQPPIGHLTVDPHRNRESRHAST
jgi:hypothetical protein